MTEQSFPCNSQFPKMAAGSLLSVHPQKSCRHAVLQKYELGRAWVSHFRRPCLPPRLGRIMKDDHPKQILRNSPWPLGASKQAQLTGVDNREASESMRAFLFHRTQRPDESRKERPSCVIQGAQAGCCLSPARASVFAPHSTSEGHVSRGGVL